eukprot:CAMPEP_0194339442 /NCGR_PEP_ID=MMETSP0171-20130528/83158_1 /TAXON_ID=218684 /ORGANISM="Corethron pennatum, Strain L29A3" /LENGTH=116 /DNA_ID=CAMNT_0039104003 /DNA_START=88 /DNA_END=434 /DNA_ORIENTATION=-
MKICGACGEQQPQASFSSKQWKTNTWRRRCRDCIEHAVGLRATDPSATPPPATGSASAAPSSSAGLSADLSSISLGKRSTAPFPAAPRSNAAILGRVVPGSRPRKKVLAELEDALR